MEFFTQFSFKSISSFFKVLVVSLVLFSWNGFSQNLLTNPSLDQAAANCNGADALRDQAPDSWAKTFTPDRSTAQERAWDGTSATRSGSPGGGCYYGFRALSGNPEGISQTVNFVKLKRSLACHREKLLL